VLPKLNSWTGIPNAIARRPANTAQIPAINKTTIIKPPHPLAPLIRRKPHPYRRYWAQGQPPIAVAVPKNKDNQQVIHAPFSIERLEPDLEKWIPAFRKVMPNQKPDARWRFNLIPSRFNCELPSRKHDLAALHQQ
jgi:hypothetical protein